MLKEQIKNTELEFLKALQNKNSITKNSLKPILTFVNSNLHKRELFFTELQTILETLLTLKLTKQEKEKVLQTLLKLNLHNNHLSNVLLYYNKLTENKISEANKFKLNQMLFNKMLMLSQTNKALLISEQIISSSLFENLTFDDQREHLLLHASILMVQHKFELNLKFKNEKLNEIIEVINNLYFKIVKNSNSTKIKHYIQDFKAFSKNTSTNAHIITNAYLNLPIVEILIKQKEIKTAQQILLGILNNSEITQHNRLKAQIMLISILKNSNINELLLKINEIEPEFLSLETKYLNLINNYTELAYENNELKKSLKEKELFLKTDSLTQCYNRGALEDISFSFKSSYGAVVFFDLNNLKVINDSLGHPAGDQYLKEFAKLILPLTNDHIKAYRYGGDEFVLIADEHDEIKVTKLLNKIFKDAKKQITIANKNLHLSFSVGVSLYPTNATNLNKLLSLADKAMYRAKAEKNCGINKFYFSK